jgi:PAS domain S-box-containing protein
VPAVPWIADHFGQHTYLSPNIETITGFTADDVVARGFSFWFEQVHPDDRCAVEQSVTRLFSKAIPYDISYR